MDMSCIKFTYVLFAVSLINLEICYGFVHDRAKIVTYGEPCYATRELPIKIEGPKPPVVEEKIPISLDFRVNTDMFVQPRRVEYPIAIQVPTTAAPPVERIIIENDDLKGKTYSYNTYVPPASNPLPPANNYNFAVDIPVSVRELTIEQPEQRQVEKLKGLVSRVDRILVPACEVSSSPFKCQ